MSTGHVAVQVSVHKDGRLDGDPLLTFRSVPPPPFSFKFFGCWADQRFSFPANPAYQMMLFPVHRSLFPAMEWSDTKELVG